jgi:hypothetical protein
MILNGLREKEVSAAKQDPKDVKTEQQEEAKTTDELTDEELDQVAGGGVEPSPWLPPAQPGPGLNLENQSNLNAKDWGASKAD